MRSERVLKIRGGHNFRDLGGYSTKDGRAVRWGVLYRSGVMSKIDATEIAALHKLGIVSICDFRTTDERRRRPTTWHVNLPLEMIVQDYEMSVGDLKNLVNDRNASRGRVRDMILGAYNDLLEEQVHNYRALFRQLVAGKVPLVFNCSAGKDRTGIAAALILSTLGVSREDVIADYMLTNAFIGNLVDILSQEPEYGRWVAEKPEIAYPLLRAEPEYLEATFRTMEQRYGSLEAYLLERLDVSGEDVEAIRAHLLE